MNHPIDCAVYPMGVNIKITGIRIALSVNMPCNDSQYEENNEMFTKMEEIVKLLKVTETITHDFIIISVLGFVSNFVTNSQLNLNLSLKINRKWTRTAICEKLTTNDSWITSTIKQKHKRKNKNKIRVKFENFIHVNVRGFTVYYGMVE